MAQYDLTPRLAQHLDRHLVFPLLEFLQSKGTYDAEDVERAKVRLGVPWGMGDGWTGLCEGCVARLLLPPLPVVHRRRCTRVDPQLTRPPSPPCALPAWRSCP